MKILHLIFPGLGTDPKSDCCGMRTTAEKVAASMPVHEHTILAFGWDENGSPDENCRMIVAAMLAAAYERVFVYAHSFGNSLLNFLVDWIEKWHDGIYSIDAAFCFDPCHNWFYFGPIDWDLRGVVKLWRSWYQHDGFRPLGVIGTPFVDPSGSHTVDVTGWNSPKLGHINDSMLGSYVGIPSDERIRAAVLAMAQAVAESRTP